MAGCGGTGCSAYSPVAGDEFILYGGDTWGTSDLPLNFNWNGSGQCLTTPNSSCIYIGVDQTWFAAITGTVNTSGTTVTWESGLRAPAACNSTFVSGSYCGGDFGYLVSGNTITINGTPYTLTSTPTAGTTNTLTLSSSAGTQSGVAFSYSYWTRPIFNQELTYESGWYGTIYCTGTDVTFDNIEITGLMTSGGNTARLVAMPYTNDVLEHSYLHGWEHASSGDSDNSTLITAVAAGTVVHDNVIDGADTLAATAVSGNPCSDPSTICQGMNTAVHGAQSVYNNIISNVTSGIDTSDDIIHDNWIGPIWLGYTGGHRNGIQVAGGISLGTMLDYNNVMTAIQNGGMGGFWLEQGSGNSGVPAYVFNNVLFNGPTYGLGEGMQFCQEGTACGPFYAFNNTVENTFNLASGVTATANLFNNHCILASGSDCALDEGSWTVNETTNKAQCLGTGSGCTDQNASPNYDQYTGSQTYAFSPVAATNSTVGTGTNKQTLCSTISGINSAAGTACQYATGYTCSYNTNNDTVSCPDLALIARPVSTAWDIGAYQYSGSPPPSETTTGTTGNGAHILNGGTLQ